MRDFWSESLDESSGSSVRGTGLIALTWQMFAESAGEVTEPRLDIRATSICRFGNDPKSYVDVVYLIRPSNVT